MVRYSEKHLEPHQEVRLSQRCDSGELAHPTEPASHLQDSEPVWVIASAPPAISCDHPMMMANRKGMFHLES